MKKHKGNPMANVQIIADVEVLKCDIKAGIQTSGDKTTVVVYGKADTPAPRVTLDELASEFAGMIGQSDIKLPGGIGEDLQLSLRHAYYKKVTNKSDDAETAQAASPSDYALWLDLYADQLTQGWPVKIKSVSIKVWQTDNEQILEDMDITAMKKLLG
jgi:hypothetical protein